MTERRPLPHSWDVEDRRNEDAALSDPIMIGVDFGARDIACFAMTRTIGGIRVIESIHMGEPWEDWSKVRSPGRARRRMRRGHRQNIVRRTRPMPGMIQTGDALYGHPDTIAKVVRALADKHRVKLDQAMAEAMGFAKPQRRSDDERLTLDKIQAAANLIRPLAMNPAQRDFDSIRRRIDVVLARGFGMPWVRS